MQTWSRIEAESPQRHKNKFLRNRIFGTCIAGFEDGFRRQLDSKQRKCWRYGCRTLDNETNTRGMLFSMKSTVISRL